MGSDQSKTPPQRKQKAQARSKNIPEKSQSSANSPDRNRRNNFVNHTNTPTNPSQYNLYPELDQYVYVEQRTQPAYHSPSTSNVQRTYQPAYHSPSTSNVYPIPQGSQQSHPSTSTYNTNSNVYQLPATSNTVYNKSQVIQPSAPAAYSTNNINSHGYQRPATSTTAHSTNYNQTPTNAQQGPNATNKNRSKSGTRDKGDVVCSTCRGQFSIDIFQCSRGHSSCANCKRNGLRCGLCGTPITDMRNFALQEAISERKVNCPNNGCILSFKNFELDGHLKECPYQEIECPLKDIFKRCFWRGKFSQLTNHFDDCHPESRQSGVDQEMNIPNIYFDEQYVYLIDLGPFNFLVYVTVSNSDKNISVAAQFLGTKFSADKWSYEVHFYNKGEPRRKYVYVDTCNSLTTVIKDVIKESNCAVLPLHYASSFLNGGLLTYKIFLKKKEEMNAEGAGRGRGRFRGRGRGNHNNRGAMRGKVGNE